MPHRPSMAGPCRAALALLATLTLAPASAQGTAPADPADPTRAVPRLEHRSVLRQYRPAHDVPPIDWRAANDTVTRIGGWRAYAREAAAPPGPAASQPVPGLPR